MKHLSIIFSISCLFFFSGCDLDEENYGQTTSENYYETEGQIRDALTGAYLQIRETWNEYALSHYFIGDCTTDDAWKGGSSDGDRGEVLELQNFTVYTTNGEVGRRWEILYRLINRCNEVIHYAPDASGDETLLTRYINEAKVLRAFGYYNLVTVFGGVPLILEPRTPSEVLELQRATAEQVFTQIEADLRAGFALPGKTQYSENDAYRVTSGLARTLLAKSYMFQNNFTAAETVLSEIIQSGQYQLLDQYGWNWFKEYENSTESVFELANKVIDQNTATGTNVPHFFTSRAQVPYYEGYGFHAPTQDLFDAFDADDPRITYVFVQTGDRYTDDPVAQNTESAIDGYNDYKMTVPRIDKQGWDVWMIDYNIRLIRYADVILMYAEALNENGKAGQALTYLNMIRERARNTDPRDPRREEQAYIPATTAGSVPNITTTDQTALRQAIWDERRRELAMEGWRRDDLLRQKRFGEVMRAFATKYNTAKGRNFSDARDYLLPIPQGEIDKANNQLSQNPNY